MADRLDKLLQEKLDRIDSVPKQFLGQVDNAQKAMLADINLILGQLARDGNGNVLTNQSNLSLLERLRGLLREIFRGSDYVKAVGSFAGELDKQAELSAEYYRLLSGYEPTPELLTLNAINKRKAVEQLVMGAADSAFYKPIIDSITEAVTTNAPYIETVRAIRVLTVGNDEVQGRLSRYAGQIAYDTMAITDRTFNQQVSDDLGIDFYQYTGGTIDDTRDFCQERNGKYYHREEIKEWAFLDWQGKNRSTTEGSIFVLCGGYNCKHSLIPVATSATPKDVVRRNLENGNLTLTANQRKVLGV